MLQDSVLLRIGPFSIHWYGLFMAAAFLAGFANWVWQGRGRGRDFNYCADLLFSVMLAGIVGARLAYVISDLPSFLKEPLSIIRVDQGGLIYYGGFVGAALAVIWHARRRKEPIFRLGDFAITSLPLGHAFGRLGCQVNGCCFGAPHEGLFSITYPQNSAPWWSQVYSGLITRFTERTLPVHPVQLYEAAFNCALFVVLALVFRRGKRDGRVVATYLLLYPAWRLWVETLRGDERMRFGGLDLAQWLSATFLLAGLVLFLRIRARADEPS